MPDKGVEILLVEDNPSDVKLALHAFKTNNLANHVHVVRDGAEALEFIFCTDRYATRKMENGPRVILLDLKLPLVDGIEVLRRVKSDPRTRTLPVVVMTSSKEEPDIAECYRLGVNSYIVKPVDFDRFTEAVKQLGYYWLLLNQGAGNYRLMLAKITTLSALIQEGNNGHGRSIACPDCGRQRSRLPIDGARAAAGRSGLRLAAGGQ